MLIRSILFFLVCLSFGAERRFGVSTSPILMGLAPVLGGYHFKLNGETWKDGSLNSHKISASITRINFDGSSFNLNVSGKALEYKYLKFKSEGINGVYTAMAADLNWLKKIGKTFDYDKEPDELTVLIGGLYYYGYRRSFDHIYLSIDAGLGVSLGVLTESDESDDQYGPLKFKVGPNANINLEVGYAF